MFTMTLNFFSRSNCVKFWINFLKIFYVLHLRVIKCSKGSYNCFLWLLRFVGVRWGIACATVDETGLGLVLVTGVRGSE